MPNLFTTIIIPLLILGACTHMLVAGFWSIFSTFTSLPKPTMRALGMGALAIFIALSLEALVILPFAIADVSVSIEDLIWLIVGTCFLSVFFSIAGACFAHRRITRQDN